MVVNKDRWRVEIEGTCKHFRTSILRRNCSTSSLVPWTTLGDHEDEADEEEDEEADEVEYEEEEALYDEEEDRRTVALWEAATQGFETEAGLRGVAHPSSFMAKRRSPVAVQVKSKGPQSNEFTLKIKMSQMQPRFNLRTCHAQCAHP
eukprot:315390-Amphidinium_carterae.2